MSETNPEKFLGLEPFIEYPPFVEDTGSTAYIFRELCRTGNPESIEEFLKLNKVSDHTIGFGFHKSCESNLENAKWFYNNYREVCNDYMETTVFFLQGILTDNKIETLLWLKSLNNEIFISHIDCILRVLINERKADCAEMKLLYKHFLDRFEYLNPNKNNQ
jgi:hypothetical protein